MSQRERIREYLDEGLTLNRLCAWDALGILEAPARICELRAEGYPIITTMVDIINRYGERVKIAEWTKGTIQ